MTSLSSNGVVSYVVENRIAWVNFNRPDKRNCMSPTLNRDMMEVLDLLEFRDDVGVLILSGEGTAWSAGMDLKEYFRESEAKGLGATRQVQREAYGWWRRLRWFQKPTIAMVNGWCFGGGYGPLFGCDLAFAADEAQFGLSEINWGILPGGGATKVAVELLPFRKAMYHAMMGENIDGKTAVGAIELDGKATDVKIQVSTPGGQVIDTVSLGALDAGQHGFSLDATKYPADTELKFKVIAVNGADTVTSTSLMRDKVVAVGSDASGLNLTLLNAGSTPYSSVHAVL